MSELIPYMGTHVCGDIDIAIDRAAKIPQMETAISALEESVDAKQASLTFDNAPTAYSANPVTSGGIKTALDGKQDALTTVQLAAVNSGVTSDIVSAVSNKQDTLTFDSTPTQSSTNPVTSGGIKTALDGKQNALTFDSTPTQSSTNPVTSGGIKTALDGKQDALTGTQMEAVNSGINSETLDDVRNDIRFFSVPNLKELSLSPDGTLRLDFIETSRFTQYSTLSATNFYSTNLMTYKDYLTTSSTAKISDPIRVRDAYGNMLWNLSCTYGDNIGTAPICFGYKSDWSHDRIYRSEDVANGKLVLDATTYYICVIKYNNIDLTLDSVIGTIDGYVSADGKQDTLTETQMEAVNSGVTNDVVDDVETLKNKSDLKYFAVPNSLSLTVTRTKDLVIDLIASSSFTPNSTLTADNFNRSTLLTYKSYLTTSSTAKVSDPIRVRDADGRIINDILCTYGDNILEANICFGYKADWTPDKIYKAADVEQGTLVVSPTTYYICILKYSTIDLTMNAVIGSVDDLNGISGDIIPESASASNKLATANDVTKIGIDERFSSIPDMHSISIAEGNALAVDLIDSAKFTNGVTLTLANFNESNLGNYKTYFTSSATAKVSDPIRVRDAYGNMISDILCTYGDNILSATICFGYKEDWTRDRVYKAADVVNGVLTLDSSTHYICILKYSTVDLTLKAIVGRLDNFSGTPHYEVGPGKTYTTLTSCLRALASDSSEKVIDIYGGEYDILDEMGGAAFLASLTGSEHWYDVCDIVPPNTTLIGHGNVIIKMELPANTPNSVATLLSPINMQGSATLKNLTIIGSNCRYCVHPEGSKFSEFDNAHWVIEDCYIEKTSTDIGTANAIACGLNNGVLFNVRNSVIKSSSTGAFSMHDNGDVYAVSPTVFFEHCALISTAYSLIYSCTKRENMQTVIKVMVNDCYLTNYTRKTAASENTKDIYKVTYINSPHNTQDSANLIDLIPDTNYSNYTS